MANFDEKAGGIIPLKTAKEWTANYRRTINPDETRAHYFGSDIIQKLLNLNNAVGVRIYYGIDDKGQKQLVLVGVDANGNDLLPSSETSTTSNGPDQPFVADFALPCPTFCSGGGGGLNG